MSSMDKGFMEFLGILFLGVCCYIIAAFLFLQ